MSDELRTAYLGRFDPLAIPIILEMLSDAGIFATTKLPYDQPARSQYITFSTSTGADMVLVDAEKLDEARGLVNERLPQILSELSAELEDEFGGEAP